MSFATTKIYFTKHFSHCYSREFSGDILFEIDYIYLGGGGCPLKNPLFTKSLPDFRPIFGWILANFCNFFQLRGRGGAAAPRPMSLTLVLKDTYLTSSNTCLSRANCSAGKCYSFKQ